MPTYVLDENKPARIRTGAVRVQVHASAAARGLTLKAVSGGAPAEGAISPAADLLVLPRLSGRTTVVVTAPRGGMFANGSVLNITVSLDGVPTADPERAVLSNVDVSGLATRDLVSLELVDDSILLTSNVGGGELPLSALAKVAQVATRAILGVDSVDATAALNVVVAVDGSASMLRPTRDGDLEAMLEVLAGVSSVISPGRSLRGAVVTGDVQWVEPQHAGHLATEIAQVQEERALGIGFRSAHPGLTGHTPDQNTITYVLTDSLPADIDALRAADEVEGEARHLVVFGDSESMAVHGDPGLTSTVVPPVPGEEGLGGRLEVDAAALKAVIISLLRGCFVPGTVFAKRVGA